MRPLFVFLGLGICLQQGAACGQVTANALHNRYPAPLQEEIEVRPGISLTVRYGTGLIACEVRVHPTGTSLFQKKPEILFSGCNEQSTHTYEFVDIMRSSHECLPLQTAREFPATLVFKRPECAALQQARLRQPTKQSP